MNFNFEVRKGFVPTIPYKYYQEERVRFGLYSVIDNSIESEISMVWKQTSNGYEYGMFIPSDSWRVVVESPYLFQLLYKLDNGNLRPKGFYEILNKAGYDVL